MNTKATIIYGGQGVGKTTLAGDIVAAYNAPYWMSGGAFVSAFGFANLPPGTDVVVVDEMFFDARGIRRAKEVMSSDTFIVHRQNQPPVIRPRPDFVFVVQGSAPSGDVLSDRRFEVLGVA